MVLKTPETDMNCTEPEDAISKSLAADHDQCMAHLCALEAKASPRGINSEGLRSRRASKSDIIEVFDVTQEALERSLEMACMRVVPDAMNSFKDSISIVDRLADLLNKQEVDDDNGSTTDDIRGFSSESSGDANEDFKTPRTTFIEVMEDMIPDEENEAVMEPHPSQWLTVSKHALTCKPTTPTVSQVTTNVAKTLRRIAPERSIIIYQSERLQKIPVPTVVALGESFTVKQRWLLRVDR